MISLIFNKVFYEPLLNSLVWLIGILPFHDVGFAVIILTIVVRLIIFPFTHNATVTQNKMKNLEPELKEIKEKFKNNSQEQTKKTMELYKRHGINPVSGILALFVQLPILFALYRVFLNGGGFDVSHLYHFISVPDFINTKFLGLIDMSKKSYILAGLASVSQFFQMRLAMPPLKKSSNETNSFKDNLAKSMSIQMRYIMPFFIFYIALRFSSALALYWTTMNIFAIVHETIVRKKAQKLYGDGTTGKNNQVAIGTNS
ncbi:MAG: YidC/Oxa1 family membrane protein insertase [Candidatus Parcubacteria bacterium]|nr:YidC/Oxa1 family membrane protein insertase [Candidatus Parcubacteria bacterium]